MTIFYEFEGKLYANITNRCPCSCVFCIRKNGDSVADNDSLWLEHEPSYEEIIKAFDDFDKTGLHELVFCGYGEPTCELEILKETAKYIKSVTKTPVRLNTNGLSDLINKRETPAEFKGLVDIISISLNASDAKAYDEVTRPSFKGVNCFEEMLSFAKRVKEFVPEVMLTVVDIIGEEEIKKSQAVADSVGIHLRVREYVD